MKILIPVLALVVGVVFAIAVGLSGSPGADSTETVPSPAVVTSTVVESLEADVDALEGKTDASEPAPNATIDAADEAGAGVATLAETETDTVATATDATIRGGRHGHGSRYRRHPRPRRH